MTTKVRFAPSPTGYIHIGNARTALLNWLYSRDTGGTFLLRLDDTDVERSKTEYAEAIVEDLAWLGIVPDEVARQSDRTEKYDVTAERLKADGRLYACYETPDELERKRKRLLARGRPPVYDRAALDLDAGQIAALEAEDRKPHWRFKLENRAVRWKDEVRGNQSIEAGSLSDPVLIRADGSYLYTLPSVVDDIEYGVTLIVRGEDHVANTGVQIQIFEALGATPPGFAHHNLLTDASGEGLSKRMESLSLRSLRSDGFEPMAVASLATTIGTSEPVSPHPDITALATIFGFSKISRSPARFDYAELESLNAKLLHQTPFADAASRLSELDISGGEEFWNAVRGNLEKFADISLWWNVVAGDVNAAADNLEFLGKAASLLPSEPWDEATWSAWTGSVKAETGAKGRELFHPLRKALTGEDRGPEMSVLLPLIGRETVLKRLAG